MDWSSDISRLKMDTRHVRFGAEADIAEYIDLETAKCNKVTMRMVPISLAYLASSLSVATITLPSSAESEEAVNWLSESEIEEHLLGKRLRGFLDHHSSMHLYWSECIDLNGKTVYRSWSTEHKVGQLFTKSPDHACFKYDDEEACFRVRPYFDGYLFQPVKGKLADFDLNFIAAHVEPQSQACEPD